MSDFRRDFLAFALACEVLRFGDFTTKAGRKTPYFFNAGLFSDGDSLRTLGQFYARALQASGVACDQLFGPAYKGIPLAASTAIALSEIGQNLPWSFNRKEAKDHGEGGVVVGAPLRGRVLIVGRCDHGRTSVRESVGPHPEPRRQPRRRAHCVGQDGAGAGQRVGGAGGARVIRNTGRRDCHARRPHGFLGSRADLTAHGAAVDAYRRQYGALESAT
jgi:orotate phosphoribosyltransferase